MGYIRPRFGKYLDLLEQKNMTNEKYEYSFEAFAELVALTPFNFQRDKHWHSMHGYCTPCLFNYDFITKQEMTSTDYPAILDLTGYQAKYPKLHIPGRFNTSLETSKIAEPYRDLSQTVIRNLYKNYYA